MAVSVRCACNIDHTVWAELAFCSDRRFSAGVYAFKCALCQRSKCSKRHVPAAVQRLRPVQPAGPARLVDIFQDKRTARLHGARKIDQESLNTFAGKRFSCRYVVLTSTILEHVQQNWRAFFVRMRAGLGRLDVTCTPRLEETLETGAKLAHKGSRLSELNSATPKKRAGGTAPPAFFALPFGPGSVDQPVMPGIVARRQGALRAEPDRAA